MPKLTWNESFTTIAHYSAIITEEQAKLFTEDKYKFFEEVDYSADQQLEWDNIGNEDSHDFEISEE